MRYTPTLGIMGEESRLAIAALDMALAMGFHAGVYHSRSSVPSRTVYLVVQYARGQAMIRISDHRMPYLKRQQKGEPALDLITTRETFDGALERVGRALRQLERVEGASPPRRLPAAFCGRLEAA